MGNPCGITIPLLDYLAWRMGCTYLSDLRFLSGRERNRLAREIEKLPLDSVALQEWNDVLKYLTGGTVVETGEKARCELIAALSVAETAENGQTEVGIGQHSHPLLFNELQILRR